MSAPMAAGPLSAKQAASMSAGFGPVSGGYANQLYGQGLLNSSLANNTLAGLGYGGAGSLSTYGGW